MMMQSRCRAAEKNEAVSLHCAKRINSIHSFSGFRSLAGVLQAPTCVCSVTGPFAWLSGTQICAKQAPRCVAKCWLKLQVALVKRPRSESMSALRIFDAASSAKSHMGQSQRMRQGLIAVRNGDLSLQPLCTSILSIDDRGHSVSTGLTSQQPGFGFAALLSVMLRRFLVGER